MMQKYTCRRRRTVPPVSRYNPETESRVNLFARKDVNQRICRKLIVSIVFVFEPHPHTDYTARCIIYVPVCLTCGVAVFTCVRAEIEVPDETKNINTPVQYGSIFTYISMKTITLKRSCTLGGYV